VFQGVDLTLRSNQSSRRLSLLAKINELGLRVLNLEHLKAMLEA
jgi:hypothetical protein